MSLRSSGLEAHIRAALNERLGETCRTTRFHRHNDMVYLEIHGTQGLERTVKSVEQALDGIGPFLRSEKITLNVTVSSTWQPRWQSQAVARANDELDAVPALAGRRAAR
jgi:hypothetical protein